jgi:ribonuclease BN (tRNA processing enzyme)
MGLRISEPLLGRADEVIQQHVPFGPSILVEAGGQKFLFDAGRGALQRLNQVKIRWQDVHGVFLTHLHSDHVVGFPDLWLTGWLTPDRDVPLQVWEPRCTTKMMSYPEQAYEYDIRLIHEVAAPETFQRAGSAPERAKSVIAHHVTREQVGESSRNVGSSLKRFVRLGSEMGRISPLSAPGFTWAWIVLGSLRIGRFGTRN